MFKVEMKRQVFRWSIYQIHAGADADLLHGLNTNK